MEPSTLVYASAGVASPYLARPPLVTVSWLCQMQSHCHSRPPPIFESLQPKQLPPTTLLPRPRSLESSVTAGGFYSAQEEQPDGAPEPPSPSTGPKAKAVPKAKRLQPRGAGFGMSRGCCKGPTRASSSQHQRGPCRWPLRPNPSIAAKSGDHASAQWIWGLDLLASWATIALAKRRKSRQRGPRANPAFPANRKRRLDRRAASRVGFPPRAAAVPV